MRKPPTASFHIQSSPERTHKPEERRRGEVPLPTTTNRERSSGMRQPTWRPTAPGMMAADVSSVARLLRGEAGKKGGPEIVTMDLLSGCGGGAAAEDEVVDLESGKTFLTPRHQSVQADHQDLNLPPPVAAAAPTTNSPAVRTLNMVRSSLEHATAPRTTALPATSSTSSALTSSSSSSTRKHNLSPLPLMRAAVCLSCLTYVLIAEEDPWCPRCSARVPPLDGKKSDAAAEGSEKKLRIDLNAAADETE